MHGNRHIVPDKTRHKLFLVHRQINIDIYTKNIHAQIDKETKILKQKDMHILSRISRIDRQTQKHTHKDINTYTHSNTGRENKGGIDDKKQMYTLITSCKHKNIHTNEHKHSHKYIHTQKQIDTPTRTEL